MRPRLAFEGNTLRILMITDFYWPLVGGVEQHVRHLAQQLTLRGHRVAVATLWQDGLPDEELDGQVQVYRVRGMLQRVAPLFQHSRRRWAPPFPDPEVLAGLRHIVKEERPEIVHGHDWLARSFFPLKASSGAKFVMGLHYYTVSCAKKSLMYQDAPCDGPGLRKCLECAGRHYGAVKGVPIVLGNWGTHAVERRLVDLYLPVSTATAAGNGLAEAGLPYRVVPNFLPEDASADCEKVVPFLRQLPAGPFLLFVGDLRRYKGIDVLLEAYANLSSVPPLVLIGKVWPESPERFPIGVTLLRDWPNVAVLAAWKRSMMGLVPSLWPEPFGIVVLEAMAAGVPVIGSRIGGIPEIVVDGKSGLLVPPADPGALASAIGRLLRDEPLRHRMGQAAALRAADFRADAIVPKFELIYRGLLSTS